MCWLVAITIENKFRGYKETIERSVSFIRGGHHYTDQGYISHLQANHLRKPTLIKVHHVRGFQDRRPLSNQLQTQAMEQFKASVLSSFILKKEPSMEVTRGNEEVDNIQY
uniref:Uncharacterized protein n=1 Tax=Aegilops tauschii TaxID=37682 RepID=M8BD79_AEGTA